MTITLILPAGKRVISLTGLLSNISKRKSVLGLAFILFCVFPVKLGSETLEVTTYYPAPFGAYASLLTTGSALLARDGGSVEIGTTVLTPAAPNGLSGNLYVNDIYLRGRIWSGTTGTWASRLPITTIYTAGREPGLSCMLNSETITGAGCSADWGFTLEWTIKLPQVKICVPFTKICATIGPYTIPIGPFTLSYIMKCGTEPAGDGKSMWFLYPSILPTSTTWIACVRNSE